jgi:uncharacterized membrane protein HdeD (DUF308 family)
MSQPSLFPDSDLQAVVTRSLHEHWKLFLAEGIIVTLLGFAAIIVPPLAGLFAAVFIGWLLLFAGSVGLYFTFRAQQAPGFWWSLLSALAAVLAGAILLLNPLEGLITLTYVLVAFFVLDGGLMILLAIEHRRRYSGRWEWVLLNGVVDLVLAAIIIAGLPGTLAWALGLLLGIDLVFGGGSLIAMALDARSRPAE